MRVCKIVQHHFPWDIRTDKITQSLCRKGHEVHLLSRNTKGAAAHEKLNGIHIYRFCIFGKNFLSTPVFCNPLWFFNIAAMVRKIRPDVILVRDLPMALSAIAVGRLFKIPVVFDMAENYPAALKDWLHTEKGIAAFIKNSTVRNYKLAQLIEKAAVTLSNHVFVVVEEQKERLLTWVPASKVSIVSNTPDVRLWDVDIAKVQDNFDTCGKEFVIFYVGEIHPHRGLDTAVAAVGKLVKEIPHIRLVLAGSGEGMVSLKQSAKDAGIEQNVIFKGFVDFKLVPALIAQSHICIIPHYVSEHINTTIPNKVFDYMALGRPVIVSNAIPLKRVVETNTCGLVFTSGDADDLAGKIKYLYENPAVMRHYSVSGKAAVMQRFNWAVDEDVMMQVLEKCKVV